MRVNLGLPRDERFGDFDWRYFTFAHAPSKLQALADLAECSKSMLSKIESDRVVPSLPTLQRIAKALEITLANLLADPPEGEIVSRPGTRPVLDVDPLRRGEGIQYERLVPFGQAVLLEANIHIIEPQGGREDPIQHQGEELGLVLEGQLELIVGAVPIWPVHKIRSSSSVLGHRYRNPGPGITRVVWVNTPPVH
jgi:transcriptional regulator with XRE-family HTH domain